MAHGANTGRRTLVPCGQRRVNMSYLWKARVSASLKAIVQVSTISSCFSEKMPGINATLESVKLTASDSN